MVSTNKGYWFSLPPLLLSFFLVLVAVTIISFENNPSLTPDSFSNLTWKQISLNSSDNNTISLLVNKFINFFGESVMIIAQETIRWSYHNQEVINAKLLLWLVITAFLVPIIYPLFMIMVVLFLLFREWYLSKKEKNHDY